MAKKRQDIATLVNKLPDPDEHGLLSVIDKEVVENVIDELRRGGPVRQAQGQLRSLRALIDMLAVPGEGEDFNPPDVRRIKARYAIHVWAVKVCQNAEKDRRLFATTLASQLGGDRPKPVQEFLIQQLQVAGHQEVVPALGKLLCDDELCDAAAMALVAIGTGAAEQLRAALPKAKGRCRLIILQNLGVVRDHGAIDALREAAHDQDRENRVAAIWALANIGDSQSVDLLLEAADKSQGWERIKATKACLLLAENLMTAGKKTEAKKIYSHLADTRTGHEQYIREAAESPPPPKGGG